MCNGPGRASLVLTGLLLACSSSSSSSGNIAGRTSSGGASSGGASSGGAGSGGATASSGGAGGSSPATSQSGGNAGASAGRTGSAGGASGGSSTSGRDGGILDCTEGISCPTPGESCTSSSGVLCSCNGPPGSAILSCNISSTAGSSGTASGGSSGGSGGTTNASGGATAGIRTGGAATGGVGGSGGVTTGGQQTGGSTGGSSNVGVTCTGSAPWGTGNGDVQLVVDAGQKGQAWSRFYEKGVALDHANTILSTAYGRNAKAALKKGHDQAGFQYVRFHGILNDDIGVYSESNGTATYDWTRLDQVYDAIVAAGMKPIVEISFTPSAMASTSKVLTTLWYNNKSPNISKPKDWTKWEAFMTAIVQHLESHYGAAEVRSNWFFEV